MHIFHWFVGGSLSILFLLTLLRIDKAMKRQVNPSCKILINIEITFLSVVIISADVALIIQDIQPILCGGHLNILKLTQG